MRDNLERFKVGDWIMGMAPICRGKREIGGSSLFGGPVAVIDNIDRSYMIRPYEIVALDLPYASLRPIDSYEGRAYTQDLRECEWKIMDQAFIESLKAKEPPRA